MNSGNTETLKSLSRFIKKILNNVVSSWLSSRHLHVFCIYFPFFAIVFCFSFFVTFTQKPVRFVYIYICTSCISDLVFWVNKEWNNWGQFNFFMFLPLWYSDIITTYDMCWSFWMTGLKKIPRHVILWQAVFSPRP